MVCLDYLSSWGPFAQVRDPNVYNKLTHTAHRHPLQCYFEQNLFGTQSATGKRQGHFAPSLPDCWDKHAIRASLKRCVAYIYVYIHVCIYIYICIYIYDRWRHTQKHTLVCRCMCTHMQIHVTCPYGHMFCPPGNLGFGGCAGRPTELSGTRRVPHGPARGSWARFWEC